MRVNDLRKAEFIMQVKLAATKAKEEKPGIVAPVAATAAGLKVTGAGHRGVVGLKRVYHGTADKGRAKAIKSSGLQPSLGGTGAGRFAPEFVERSKGKVHVTPKKTIARMYAAMDEGVLKDYFVNREPDRGMKRNIKRAIMGKGHVIAADIPHKQWAERFVADPDMGGKKSVAATSTAPIESKYVRGGKGRLKSFFGRQKELAKNLPGYIKNNPKRFAKGLGLTGAGLALTGYGVKNLRKRFGSNDGQ